MRIWDISPRKLCTQHLVGEHRELHAVWSILTAAEPGEKGYYHHPETQRWVGYLPALKIRHDELVKEARRRELPMGLNHQSPLPFPPPEGRSEQDQLIDRPDQQLKMLAQKSCPCPLPEHS